MLLNIHGNVTHATLHTIILHMTSHMLLDIHGLASLTVCSLSRTELVYAARPPSVIETHLLTLVFKVSMFQFLFSAFLLGLF